MYTGVPPLLAVAPLGFADDQAWGEDHQEVDHDGEEDEGAGGQGDRLEVRPLRGARHGRRLSRKWLRWTFCSSFKDRLRQPCGKSGEGHNQVKKPSTSKSDDFFAFSFKWPLTPAPWFEIEIESRQ